MNDTKDLRKDFINTDCMDCDLHKTKIEKQACTKHYSCFNKYLIGEINKSEQFANDNAKLAGDCLIRATKTEQIIKDVEKECKSYGWHKNVNGHYNNDYKTIVKRIQEIIKSKLKENKLEDVSADVEPVSIDSVIPDSLESKEDR